MFYDLAVFRSCCFCFSCGRPREATAKSPPAAANRNLIIFPLVGRPREATAKPPRSQVNGKARSHQVWDARCCMQLASQAHPRDYGNPYRMPKAGLTFVSGPHILKSFRLSPWHSLGCKVRLGCSIPVALFASQWLPSLGMHLVFASQGLRKACPQREFLKEVRQKGSPRFPRRCPPVEFLKED